jgi:hypothetical protein
MHFEKMTGNWRQLQRNVEAQWAELKNGDLTGSTALSKKLLVGVAILTAFSSQAIAAPGDNETKHERQVERRAERVQQRADRQSQRESRQEVRRDARVEQRQENRRNNQEDNQAASRADFRAANQAAYQEANREAGRAASRAANQEATRNQEANQAANRAATRAASRADFRAANQAANRADIRAANRRDFRADIRANNQAANRWDYRLDNRRRYQAYRHYRNNWSEQRVYLRTNLSRFNQLARLNQLQQQQLDNQMRAAYLSYHNNQWNGPFGWNNYSDPQFIDYLQTRNPSLLQTILSALGLGGEDDYLYSSEWDSERSQLAQNMADIHQLALEGRITRLQEQDLMDDLRAEFMAYHNNQWNGSVGWSQYSDPGFVDYLNNRRPSVLATVRDYLAM